MESLINSSIAIARTIASNLCPAILDDLGLNAAIEWYCSEMKKSEMKKRTWISYQITGHATDILQENIKITLFRIFQEAMTNIIRHSKADKFDVELKSTDDSFVMIIKDNGIG